VPRRMVATVLIPVIVVAAAASGLIYHRVSMSFQEGFAPDSGRLAMVAVGFQMIQDHPLFGVGPQRISREFPRYYGNTTPTNFFFGHLHNNILQIAAERGLLCLAAFLWMVFEMFAGLIRVFRAADERARWCAVSGITALAGFLVAGLFEFNFGDSEVLLLLLFLISAPMGVGQHASDLP
jgi:putative inorganic carbon (hco3(-)) transporter